MVPGVFVCGGDCDLPADLCGDFGGVQERQGAGAFAFRDSGSFGRDGGVAFAAALSDAWSFYQSAVFYAGVSGGVLEQYEDCGWDFVGADVCGGSCGVGVCKVFVPGEAGALSVVCDFDADAV